MANHKSLLPLAEYQKNLTMILKQVYLLGTREVVKVSQLAAKKKMV